MIDTRENCSTLFELDDLFMGHNASPFPMNIKILDDELYYADHIDHYLNIIESPLSVIKEQYSDIGKIKSFITNNKITTKKFIEMFEEFISYSKYFKESFDMIDDIKIRNFIIFNIETINLMANNTAHSIMRFNQEDINFEVPDPFDGNRINKSILESFNIIKVQNYWSSLNIKSEFVDVNEFKIDISKKSKESKKQYDFDKLKPNFDIKENSVTAIWYLALLHAYCDGIIDKTDNYLLVNTLKVCLYTTAVVHEIDNFENYVNQSSKDNDRLMDFVENNINNITKLTDIELWDAYLSAADKITNPDLQDLSIAICVWVAQVSNADIQNKAIGKLIMEWHRYSNDATSYWIDEINAYASGEKG